MCKYLKRKHVSGEVMDEKNRKYHRQVRVKEKRVMLKKNRLYSDSCLAIGFIWTGEEDCPLLCALFAGKSSPTELWPQPS